MGLSRQEYWSGWPCPPPGDLPNPGIETRLNRVPHPPAPTTQIPALPLIAQLVKNPPAMQETPVQFLGWEDPLEKG